MKSPHKTFSVLGIIVAGIFSISTFNTIGALIALNMTNSNNCDEKMQK